MSDIVKSGDAVWQNAVFAQPEEAMMREIRTKMTFCYITNRVVWAEGKKPYNASKDGLPGTLRKDGYRYVKLGKSFIPISRIAFYLTHGAWPKGAVRFVNGDTSNFAPDNLIDNGDRGSPLSLAAMEKIEKATQAHRALLFDAHNAAEQAESGLYYLAHEREHKIALEVRRLDEYANSGPAALWGNATPAEDRRLKAEATCDAMYAPRDAVDRQLKRLGATPPADRAEAFRLLQMLS